MAEGIILENVVKTYGSGDTAVHALRGVGGGGEAAEHECDKEGAAHVGPRACADVGGRQRG